MTCPFAFRSPRLIAMGLLLVFGAGSLDAQDSLYIREHYAKHEVLIPMRDGVRLFTTIYAPQDTTEPYPILLQRTPYGVGPYGPNLYVSSLGPSSASLREGFIFVYQDVRGRMMSEGEFVNMTPHRPVKRSPKDVDESSDTYDTVEWLVNKIPRNNGRVGLWGISYPGFYAAAGMIDAHPALKAVSPQAPIADWFVGDDVHHNGAFFLMDAFSFFSGFGLPRPSPTTEGAKGMEFTMPDAYRFYLDLGSLHHADEKYFKKSIPFWNDLMVHGTYDEFWRARNIVPHLKNIRPAVLVVGGWFDAEDLYGPLAMFRAIQRKGPGARFTLVMGPWPHGGWSSSTGESLGGISFGGRTSEYFQDKVELPFFTHTLKGKDDPELPTALVFETGSNVWRSYERWPPAGMVKKSLYLRENSGLSFEPAKAKNGYDEYRSDPGKPVPYTAQVALARGTSYMIEDQRFAFSRPDVLSYETLPLEHSMTVAGPITADLYVSTTGTDADFVVKLIDVIPDSASDPVPNPEGVRMGGYQMLVRGDIMRGKFRKSLQRPEPFRPGAVTPLRFDLRDVNHTFLRGHRIMVQIQSSWFPLADRNPQTFLDIPRARERDFVKSTQRVYRTKRGASKLEMLVKREP